MNNKDFLVEVATISKIKNEEAQACCDAILKTLESMLTNGEDVLIHGFGRFGVEKTYEHIVEKDGAKMLMPPQLDVVYDAENSANAAGEGQHTASQSFITMLAQRLECSSDDAEILTFAFFKAIVNGLAKDKVTKVKNLGQFKINPSKIKEKDQEGSSMLFLSEALGSVAFTPDNVLKTAVNKPFEQFQPVTLNEGVQFDDLEVGVVRRERVTEVSEETNMRVEHKASSQVEEKPHREEQPSVDDKPVKEENTLGEEKAPLEAVSETEEKSTAVDMPRTPSGKWKWWVAAACAVAALVTLILVLMPKNTLESPELAAASSTPVDSVSTTQATTKEEDFTEANERVRYGAYKIVGVDTAIILQQGQTLLTISATYFGGIQMEPYIKAVNGGKSDFVAGDYVKIPKLEVK